MKKPRYLTIAWFLSALLCTIIDAKLPTEQDIETLIKEVRSEAQDAAQQWYQTYIGTASPDQQVDLANYLARYLTDVIKIEESYLDYYIRFGGLSDLGLKRDEGKAYDTYRGTPIQAAIDEMNSAIDKVLSDHQQHVELFFTRRYSNLSWLSTLIQRFNRVEIKLEFYNVLYSHLNSTAGKGLSTPAELEPLSSLYSTIKPYLEGLERFKQEL